MHTNEQHALNTTDASSTQEKHNTGMQMSTGKWMRRQLQDTVYAHSYEADRAGWTNASQLYPVAQ
jgi:hypothetical protein